MDNVNLFDLAVTSPVQEVGTGVCERRAEGVCGGSSGSDVAVETEEEICSGIEGATCRDEWDRAWCQCPTGTSGDNCQNGEKAMHHGK